MIPSPAVATLFGWTASLDSEVAVEAHIARLSHSYLSRPTWTYHFCLSRSPQSRSSLIRRLKIYIFSSAVLDDRCLTSPVPGSLVFRLFCLLFGNCNATYTLASFRSLTILFHIGHPSYDLLYKVGEYSNSSHHNSFGTLWTSKSAHRTNPRLLPRAINPQVTSLCH